jgi:hypothetical protein
MEEKAMLLSKINWSFCFVRQGNSYGGVPNTTFQTGAGYSHGQGKYQGGGGNYGGQGGIYSGQQRSRGAFRQISHFPFIWCCMEW